MFKKLVLLFVVLISFPAIAQNTTCPTRPVGDSTNACASTRFVQDAIEGGSVVPVTSRAALLAESTTTTVAFDSSLWIWNGGDLSGTILKSAQTSTAVDAGTGNITLTSHGLTTGNVVLISASLDGFVTNTKYYVIFVDYDTFRLATSYDNAQASTHITPTATSNITWRRLYDPAQGFYVTPTADLSGASGAWVRQENLRLVKWRYFGADPTGVSYSDEAIAGARDFFDSSYDSSRNLYQAQIDPEGGTYKANYSVNMTGFQGTTNARGTFASSIKIITEATDSIGVDFTNSGFVDAQSIIVLNTNPAKAPKIGVAFQRRTPVSGVDKPAINNTVQSLRVAGNFGCAAFVNFGSESMRIDALESSNRNSDPNAAATIVAGDVPKINSRCTGGLPSSKYQLAATTESSMAGVHFSFHQAQKIPPYHCTITGMTKANPIVVTVDNTGGCFDTANSTYGLVNDGKVFLGQVIGDDGSINTSTWSLPLAYHVFTVKNINTGAKTFELYSEDGLSTVDATGFTGSFSSGTNALGRDIGSPFEIARAAGFSQSYGYFYSETAAPILIDASYNGTTGSLDYHKGIIIRGRSELAMTYLARFYASGGAATIHDISIQVDVSNARDAYIDTEGASTVTFENFELKVGNNNQFVVSQVFSAPSFAIIRGGEIHIPDTAVLTSPLGRANLRENECVSWLGDPTNTVIGKVCADGTNLVLQSKSGGAVRFGDSGTQYYAASSGNLSPLTNNARSSGTSSFRWSNIFSVLGNFSGGITATGLPTSGGTVSGTLCIDTAGIIYVKTTAGACL